MRDETYIKVDPKSKYSKQALLPEGWAYIGMTDWMEFDFGVGAFSTTPRTRQWRRAWLIWPTIPQGRRAPIGSVFYRIRNHGLLASARRNANIAKVRMLLGTEVAK